MFTSAFSLRCAVSLGNIEQNLSSSAVQSLRNARNPGKSEINLGMATKGFEVSGQFFRRPQIVLIEERNISTARGVQPGVRCRGCAMVRLPENPNPRIAQTQDAIDRAVRRAIVDDD